VRPLLNTAQGAGVSAFICDTRPSKMNAGALRAARAGIPVPEFAQ
jgi:hypothetical protein